MRVLAIGDTHAPFAHADALDFLADLQRRHKPHAVVHIGDLGDQYGWKSHDDLDPDYTGPAQEVEECRVWCKKLYKLFPKAKVCFGNHDERLAKAANRSLIPKKLVATIREIYETPRGWEWSHGHEIDDVVYTRIFGCSTGCLVDPDSFALAYTRKFANKPVLGSVIVDNGVPQFFPMG